MEAGGAFMNIETRHLLEEATMAILCVHPELAETSCLRPDMFLDADYRKIFASLARNGRGDEIELSEQHVTETYQKLKCYHLDDHQMWDRYEDFFSGYEKRLTKAYVDGVHGYLSTQLARGEISYTDFLDSYEKASHIAPVNDGPLTMAGMKKNMKSARAPIFIPGLDSLSEKLNLGTTDLVTVGGGPARGKSAFMINLAERFSRDRSNQVIYYNIEMDSASATSRMICATGENITMGEVKRAGESGNYPGDICQVMSEIERRGNIYFTDGMTDIDEICSDVLRKRDKNKTQIIFVDYVGLVTTEREVKGYSVIQDVVKRLRVFALRHKVLIVMASQLTRDSTINNSESLYSYADSSEIERSSTHALLLTIPEGSAAYEASMLAKKRHARLINLEISKNRNGSTGTYRFEFDLDRQKFLPLETPLGPGSEE